MPEKIFVALSIALALTAPLVSDAQKTFPRKKLIEVGWDQPDTKLLRANYRQMEATAPFDGVVYVVKFNADGKSYDENKILQASPWKREWLAEPLADLKACRFTRFADNFIRVNTAPGDLKWDDEAAWAGASANMGHLAWFAKQSGSKGVCFDPECYSAPQYRWKPENGLSFEKTSEFARKRGAQIMRAMSKENPSFTFFAFWLLSLNSQNANAPDPSPSLRSEQYGLWPSFVAGLLEAAPSTVKFVDATENGYHPDDRNGYLSLYSLCRGANSPLRKLLPDHLREKYNRQVSVGFGFYLDRYLNRPSDKYYIAPLPGGTSLERLGINLEAAMEIADEYVWAYGEQSRWWKPLGVSSDWVDVNLKNTVGKGRLWEEAMPGITLALDALRDPDSSLREAAKRRSPERNLAINPNFDEEKPKGGSESGAAILDWKDGAVPGFSQWQGDDSKGEFLWDRTLHAAKLRGVKEGCFIQKRPAKQGEKFLIEIESGGSGDRLLMARWQTSDGKWVSWDHDVALGFTRRPDGTEVAQGIVTTPEKAEQLVILLVTGHQKPDETCWFKKLGVYRLNELLKPR